MRKFIFIPHANINFAYLEPSRYKYVIENSYEKVLDIFLEKFPKAKFCFETSGFTISQIALYCPRFLEKLKHACQKGKVEFIGSPYAHSILANYPYEDDLKALQFSMEAYDKYLGFVPEGGFTPEITWRKDLPKMFKAAGFKYMVTDFESYLVSNYPEASKVERNPNKDQHWGGTIPYYPIDPNMKELHFPMQVSPGFKAFNRSDRLTIKNLFYFQGRTFTFDQQLETPAPVEDPISNMMRWSGNGDGATIIYADDIEYIGTNCYYEVKYEKFKNPKVFQPAPESIGRFELFIRKVLENGQLITLKEAMDTLPTVKKKFFVEDGMAWHRTYAAAWANTPSSLEMDAIGNEIRATIKLAEKKARTKWQKESVRDAWFNLIVAENSDGRWPPPPKVPCKFNNDFCKHALTRAAEAVEWAKHT